MTKFFTAFGIAAAGLLASTAPASAAPAFDLTAPSAISGTSDLSAQHSRDRYRNEGRGYRNYNRNGYYNGPAWRGRDGRYYCRRNNGTTGLLIGGAAGGLIGNSIAGRGGDRTLGTILGVAGGALLGREVERSSSRCR